LGKRYYTAEEIVGRFTEGVTGAGPKWESRTLAGATAYGDWIAYWLPGLYRMLPGVLRMPDVYERVRRVGTYTSGTAERYRAVKIRRLAELARAVAAPARGAPPATPATPPP